jgi:hypothetical protein
VESRAGHTADKAPRNLGQLSARYLCEHLEATDNFVEFHWIAQHPLMKAIHASFGNDSLSDEKTDQVEQPFERVKHRFVISDCEEWVIN